MNRCGHHTVEKRRGGFTLIELLVVTLILGVMVGAIGACLAAGIRVFEASRSFGRAQSGAHLVLVGIERDLRNLEPYGDTLLEGDATSVRFARTIDERDAQGRLSRFSRLVVYDFDEVSGRLVRTESDHDSSEISSVPQVEVLLPDARAVSFEYLDEVRDGEWWTEWSSVTNSPAAVRVTTILDSPTGVFRMQRLVALPAQSSAADREQEETPRP